MKTLRSLVAVPVAVLALGALSACGSSSDDAEQPASAPTSDSTTSDGTSDSTASDSTGGGTLALTADGSTAGKCAVPSAEVLSGFDTAFAGTVTSLDDGTATLAVDQWYTDGDAATVTVDAPSKDMQDLLMAVDFQEGTSYLVSASGGRVSLCGFTGPETPELQSVYDQAFTG
ncbi:hypothetical protein [Nocardioides zeicaulis]|uniref:Lipoprotein n=1 Tax=Nocardioides zeicaulis TaxID=1776857 RepID=A0ABV6E3J2_9ACTN